MKRAETWSSSGPGTRRLRIIALAAIAGALVEYLWDPDRGRSRRAVTRDQARATIRHGVRQLRRYALYRQGQALGVMEESFHIFVPDNPFPDDSTLRDRIESELFRDGSVLKGEIGINVARGVVELRGQVDDRADIARTEEKARLIPGVHSIHNYLHLPGTPAPNKAPALTISSNSPAG